MHSVYINGIGIILPNIKELSELWDVLSYGEDKYFSKIETIPSFISSRKTRRMDRFSILSLYSAYKALDKFKDEINNPFEVGTVYNSMFGTLNTILDFAKCLEDDSIEASPVTFANTVINACVGHICIELGLKGISTMLLGSNYIGYSMQLIKNNRVKAVLAGGIEEYNEELFSVLRENGVRVSEGFSTLFLSREKTIDSYCEIIAYDETNLGDHYCFTKQFKIESSSIITTINNVLDKAKICAKDIDVVITASNDKMFSQDEISIINELFNSKAYILQPKCVLGDLLGASIGVNLSIAAMILKNQSIPKKLISNDEEKEIEYILVNDFNVSGNYVSFILKK